MLNALPDGVVELAVVEVERLCDGLDAPAASDRTMVAIDMARRAWVGSGLLSVNVVASRPNVPGGEIELQRVWTSNAAAYPIGGRKRKSKTPWTERLFDARLPVATEGDAAMAATFDDHAVMAGLGLHSALNIPIVAGGATVAVFNFMGTGSRWRAAEIALLRLLGSLARTWVLGEAARVVAGGRAVSA